MRLIRRVLVLMIVVVAAVLAYNYWSGNGWTLHAPASSAGVDVATAGQRSAGLANVAVAKGREAVTQIEGTLSTGALTAKIKSKMALDDHVKARSISVDTVGSVVTLGGTVDSSEERDRALRLAKDTDGVTSVVDKLEIKRPADPSR
jgi:osmotically-inducible protein OsmY